MKYPFITRSKDLFRIHLRKELYDSVLIGKVRADNPGSIESVSKNKDYYLVDLKADDCGDCLDFLNCLIYNSRG